MKVYCGRPFSGFTVNDINSYYDKIKLYFRETNIQLIIPLDIVPSKNNFIITKKMKNASGSLNDKIITKQDLFLIRKSDIVYINFKDASAVSIGSICELTVGYENNKLVVVCMEEDNVHRHCFIETMADFISEDPIECLEYIERFEEV